jgi:hypothetical protein
MPNSRADLLRQRIDLWNRTHPNQQIDTAAALAVAGQEGISGRVGDGGHAFGDFQLNDAGGVLTGKFPGWSIARKQQWASSSSGIDYALAGIGRAAGGRHGGDAVNAIVTKFERPADPGGEIARALAAYGGNQTNVGQAGPQPNVPAASFGSPGGTARPPVVRDFRSQLAAALTGAQPTGDYSQFYATLRQALQQRQPSNLPPEATPGPTHPTSAPAPAPPAPGGGGSLAFLSPLAEKFGLQTTSTTGGQHAPGSYHYQSRAEDFAGQPTREAALATYAAQHPQQFVEMFYTGPGNPGVFIKNGRVYPNSQLDRGLAAEHTNHVHLAR